MIKRLLIDNSLDQGFLNILHTAGRFYLRSLQIFEEQPEIAFLDLVYCGEVLSSYYEYTKEDLLDEKLKKYLSRIQENMENGETICDAFKNRLWQFKRKYTLTIKNLLNNYFFTNTESKEKLYALKKKDIEKRIKASYDLRSLYVHTGMRFGHFLAPISDVLNEIQIAKWVASSKKLEKLLMLCPTYIGLERIMRFCLLRFIHLNAFSIDKRLDND